MYKKQLLRLADFHPYLPDKIYTWLKGGLHVIYNQDPTLSSWVSARIEFYSDMTFTTSTFNHLDIRYDRAYHDEKRY